MESKRPINKEDVKTRIEELKFRKSKNFFSPSNLTMMAFTIMAIYISIIQYLGETKNFEGIKISIFIFSLFVSIVIILYLIVSIYSTKNNNRIQENFDILLQRKHVTEKEWDRNLEKKY